MKALYSSDLGREARLGKILLRAVSQNWDSDRCFFILVSRCLEVHQWQIGREDNEWRR